MSKKSSPLAKELEVARLAIAENKKAHKELEEVNAQLAKLLAQTRRIRERQKAR